LYWQGSISSCVITLAIRPAMDQTRLELAFSEISYQLKDWPKYILPFCLLLVKFKWIKGFEPLSLLFRLCGLWPISFIPDGTPPRNLSTVSRYNQMRSQNQIWVNRLGGHFSLMLEGRHKIKSHIAIGHISSTKVSVPRIEKDFNTQNPFPPFLHRHNANTMFYSSRINTQISRTTK
jgi:hypothetical protein